MDKNAKQFDPLIQKAIKESLAPHKEVESPEAAASLEESYVAQPKLYTQTTELVSQKTKEAHVKLYKEYTDALNRTSAELDTVDRQDANSKHSKFKALKEDEAFNLNSTWLHELYFSNCFDPHSEVFVNSSAYIELERSFGTFDDFQNDIMACALAAGNGWAVCGYNIFLKKVVNTVINEHSQNVMMGTYPLIVVDMHEHAYFRDYLTDKRSYLVAMMRQLNWNVIEERFNKMKSMQQVLK